MASSDRQGRVSGSGRLCLFAFLGAFAVFPVDLVLRVVCSDSESVHRLPLADVVLWGGLLTCVARGTLRLHRLDLLGPPLAILAIGVLSNLAHLGRDVSWIDVVQLFDYFALAFWLGLCLRRPAARALRQALYFVTLAFLALACVQSTVLAESPWRVTSVFDNRMRFGAWVAVVLALEVAAANCRSWRGVTRVGLLAMLAMFTTSTLLPLLALVAGAVAVGARHGRRRAVLAAAGASAVGLVAFLALPPAEHVGCAIGEWAARDVADRAELGRRGLEIDRMRRNLLLIGVDIADCGIELTTPNHHPLVDWPRDERREAVFEPHYVRQRYLEWQAGLFALSSSPVLGHGLGAYQKAVSANYHSFKKLKTLEPDTQSGFVKQLVTTGIAGLFALLVLLVWLVREGARLSRRPAVDAGPLPGQAVVAVTVVVGLAGFAMPVFDHGLMAIVMLIGGAAIACGDGDSSEVGE